MTKTRKVKAKPFKAVRSVVKVIEAFRDNEVLPHGVSRITNSNGSYVYDGKVVWLYPPAVTNPSPLLFRSGDIVLWNQRNGVMGAAIRRAIPQTVAVYFLWDIGLSGDKLSERLWDSLSRMSRINGTRTYDECLAIYSGAMHGLGYGAYVTLPRE